MGEEGLRGGAAVRVVGETAAHERHKRRRVRLGVGQPTGRGLRDEEQRLWRRRPREDVVTMSLW